MPAFAQIDPFQRQLLQVGYNQSFEGSPPFAGYAFFYWNRPEFYRENLTLRVAVAPVYMDSELGIAHALGPNTDLGIGVAGGGFAESYRDFQDGKHVPEESFIGSGGGSYLSLYHRFNPNQRIPLFAMLRGGLFYSTYNDSGDTGRGFQLPNDHGSANFRAGLRYGGKQPVLYPSLALELAVWAESLNRANAGSYGYDRELELNSSVGLFYGNAYFAYTFERGDNLSVSVTAGDSVNADPLSAYRLGGILPLVAEYPLIIPGYFYQEISAQRFVLFNGRYAVALDPAKRWQLTAMAATAAVGYLKGFEEPGRWNSGVGGGVSYQSESGVWKAAVSYGYGFDAIRNGSRGANVIGLFLQFDLERSLNQKRGGVPWPWQFR